MVSLLPGAWCGRRPRCVSLPFVLRVATSDSVWSQKWRPGQTLSQAEMPYCSLRPRSTTRPRPAYLNATFIRHGEAQHHLQLSLEASTAGLTRPERRAYAYSTLRPPTLSGDSLASAVWLTVRPNGADCRGQNIPPSWILGRPGHQLIEGLPRSALTRAHQPNLR